MGRNRFSVVGYQLPANQAGSQFRATDARIAEPLLPKCAQNHQTPGPGIAKGSPPLQGHRPGGFRGSPPVWVSQPPAAVTRTLVASPKKVEMAGKNPTTTVATATMPMASESEPDTV